MKYMVDIDGTIFSDTHNSNYHEAKPLVDRIAHFNNLYDQGHEIHYWTARGGNSGKDWADLTMRQLKEYGVKYTTARTGKPAYDLWIDDKAINVEAYFNENSTDRT
jgi:hypothetical protein